MSYSSSKTWISPKLEGQETPKSSYSSCKSWFSPKLEEEETPKSSYSSSKSWFSPKLEEEETLKMSYTSSKTWIAPKKMEQERFTLILENLTKVEFNPRSPFVPKTLGEWLEHRLGIAEDARKEEIRKLASRAPQYGSGAGIKKAKATPVFGGKKFKDNRSPVLALKSFWSPWHEPTKEYPQAPWPEADEMKEEGDERNTSGFGRFPALPRVPGNETVVWKQRNMVTTFPFDKVWELPKLDWNKITYDEEKMEELIGGDLLEILDA